MSDVVLQILKLTDDIEYFRPTYISHSAGCNCSSCSAYRMAVLKKKALLSTSDKSEREQEKERKKEILRARIEEAKLWQQNYVTEKFTEKQVGQTPRQRIKAMEKELRSLDD